MKVLQLDAEDAFWDDTALLRAGLLESIPRIPPVFGYDERGSDLFEAITELPTYYLTRVEWALLRAHAAEIARYLDADQIVELGSGSAKKTRELLGACQRQRPTTYFPVDVSLEMLETSGRTLSADIPGLEVVGLWGRYEQALARLRADRRDRRRVLVFLGSNIGNATPAERSALLTDIAATLGPGDGLLFSADLLKPAEVFDIGYNDPPGHRAFAEFRLNHLTHVNRRFGADFAVERYSPRAHFVERTGMVEGHLYALADQRVHLPALDLELEVRRGKSINVGFSAKFGRDQLDTELAARGMVVERWWVDAEWQYGILLARRTG